MEDALGARGTRRRRNASYKKGKEWGRRAKRGAGETSREDVASSEPGF